MCDVDEDGLTIDMITFNSIPSPERVVAIQMGESSVCIDVETIMKLEINPFNQGPWPDYVERQVEEYIRSITVEWPIRQLSGRGPPSVSVTPLDKLGAALLKMADVLDPEHPQNVLFYGGNVYKKDGTGVSVIALDLNKTLRVLDIDLTKPYYQISLLYGMNSTVGYQLWWNYALENDVEWLMAHIPGPYRQWAEDVMPDEESYLLTRELLEEYIDNIPDNQDENFQALQEIEQAIGQAYITLEQARQLVALLPDGPCQYILKHLIYARIVDKWNIQGGDEIQYYRPRGTLPDYRTRVYSVGGIRNCVYRREED